MNGFQKKQVERALTKIPTVALTDWEKEFLSTLKLRFMDRDLSPVQNKKLTEIMGKFS